MRKSILFAALLITAVLLAGCAAEKDPAGTLSKVESDMSKAESDIMSDFVDKDGVNVDSDGDGFIGSGAPSEAPDGSRPEDNAPSREPDGVSGGDDSSSSGLPDTEDGENSVSSARRYSGPESVSRRPG